MIRRLLIASLLLCCSMARANVFSISNDMTLATCTDRSLTVDVAYQFRMTVQSSQSGVPISLSNRYVRFRLYDLRDGLAVVDQRGEIIDAGQCQFVVSADVSSLQPGNYEAKSESWRTNDTLAALLSCDRVTLLRNPFDVAFTNGTGGGGGSSGTVTVEVQTISTTGINASVTANVGATVTVAAINVTLASGVGSVNGATGAVTVAGDDLDVLVGTTNGAVTVALAHRLFNATPGVPSSHNFDGTNYYWGTAANAAPVFFGTNIVVFSNVVAGGVAYVWTVPALVTQALFDVWGGGGAGMSGGWGGAGGWVQAIVPVVGGEQYDIILANGGPGGTSRAYPGGGLGYTEGMNRSNGGHGGGYSAVRKTGTTNYVIVAAGGGGFSSGYGSVAAGNAGGAVGQLGTVGNGPASPGYLAQADNIYGANARGGSNNVPAASGSFLQGGDASTSTVFGTANWGTSSLGGGGGGWIGGSGGSIGSATGVHQRCAGSSGISYANPLYVVWATSMRGAAYLYPPAQDNPRYIAGRAVGGSSSAGGNGMAAVTY